MSDNTPDHYDYPPTDRLRAASSPFTLAVQSRDKSGMSLDELINALATIQSSGFDGEPKITVQVSFSGAVRKVTAKGSRAQ